MEGTSRVGVAFAGSRNALQPAFVFGVAEFAGHVGEFENLRRVAVVLVSVDAEDLVAVADGDEEPEEEDWL